MEENEKGPAKFKDEFMKFLNCTQNGKGAADDRIYIEMIKYSNYEPLINKFNNLI